MTNFMNAFLGSTNNFDKTPSPTMTTVLLTTEFIVNYKFENSIIKRETLIAVEKIDNRGLVQIRLAEKNDLTKMFISTVDTSFFTQLKKDQSLHVTFSGFIENLSKIFDQCQQGKLEISLAREKEGFSIQFYEINSFKNITHLRLPAKEAPLPIVLFYMNQTVKQMQNQNESLISSLKYNTEELDRRANQTAQLQKENKKLKSNLKEQRDNLVVLKEQEVNYLQETLKKVNDERTSEKNRFKQLLIDLQDKLESMKKINSQLDKENAKLLKKTETLNEEVCVLKSDLSNLKEQNAKLQQNVASFKNTENEREIHVNNLKEQIQELQGKIRKDEKIKSDMLAEIQAEKKLCNSKRTSLEITTNELSKANAVISRQAEEIKKLKVSNDRRTEIALKQEETVEMQEQTIARLTEQLCILQTEIKNIRGESERFYEHLESIKNLADVIEEKCNNRLKLDFELL